MGEFAPFGSELLVNKIKPVVISDDSIEASKEKKMIDILVNNFSQKLVKNEIIAAAIAYNVIANFNNEYGISERKDALCLKISSDGKNWSEDYFPYIIVNGECIWS